MFFDALLNLKTVTSVHLDGIKVNKR